MTDFTYYCLIISYIGPTIMFAIAFIYGFFQIKDWKKKKRLEKQSDIAEKVLHYLDNSEIDFRELVEFKSNSFHIYDRNSKGNKDKMASLSPEKQEQFRKRLDQDPEELRNYIKSLRNVSMVLRKAHLISLRLSSDKAQKILSELMESLKQLIREIILVFYKLDTIITQWYVEMSAARSKRKNHKQMSTGPISKH